MCELCDNHSYMRYRSYDLDEVLALAQSGMSARGIIDDLGLKVGERAIQRQVAKYMGHKPTRRSIERYDPLRVRVVAHMKARGHDEHHCSVCGRHTLTPCAIRETKSDDSLDSLVFVCRRCATVADR